MEILQNIKNILDAISYITTAIVAITTILGIYVWFKGLLPALVRLGLGFTQRKIAIFAKLENFSDISDLLVDSGLFNKKNIVHVSSNSELGKCEALTLFLVYWPDWKDGLDDILSKKKDGTALIVYVPYGEPPIEKDNMQKLNRHRNVAVNNFRGRLLSDIVVMMITTSHKSK